MKRLQLNNNKRGTWLTSFGDMLTLILCFFLTVVSLGPLNTASARNNEDKLTKNKHNLGTTIAKSEEDELRKEISFEETVFSSNPDNQIFGLSELVNELIDTETYRIKSVSIETCNAELETKEGQSWHVSMQRALALNSQLIDTKIATPKVSLRAVGPWCALLAKPDTTGKYENIAAKLVFELDKVNNG